MIDNQWFFHVILQLMKKSSSQLTANKVRSIVKGQLIDLGLDEVPKKLKLLDNKLDRIYNSVDKLVGEVKGYREEQTVISGKISNHSEQLDNNDSRLKRVEKHLNFPTAQ